MDSAGSKLLQEARLYVQDIYRTKINPSLLFHNITHTEGVVKACEEMADYYRLSDEDRLVLLLAAWFHDTGYSAGDMDKHEEAGVGIVLQFLQQSPAAAFFPESGREQVAGCIRATRMPQSPHTLPEQILCDADLFHLGTDEFKLRTKLLRKEINLVGPIHLSKDRWSHLNRLFLEKHHYFTSYGREKLEPVKQQHLKDLLKKEGKKEEEGEDDPADQESESADRQQEKLPQGGKTVERDGKSPAGPQWAAEKGELAANGAQPVLPKPPLAAPAGLTPGAPQHVLSYAGLLQENFPGPAHNARKNGKGDKEREKDSKDKEKEKEKKSEADKSERGITTTFRITSGNHVNLSHMADNKAHILISVNSIIISIVISLLIRHLEDHHTLIFPTIILMGVSVVTMVFSILATRPTVSHGVFDRKDIENRKVNLLFFGNFYNMSLEEYEWAMKEMILDRDYMYGSIIKDIYYQGVVLARKYRYLRIAYNIFMYGIVVSVVAFSITMLFAKG